jgi:hypothetical protein
MAGEMEDEEEANHQKGRQEARVTLHGRTEWNGRTESSSAPASPSGSRASGSSSVLCLCALPYHHININRKLFYSFHTLAVRIKETLLDSFLHVWVWGFGLVKL